MPQAHVELHPRRGEIHAHSARNRLVQVVERMVSELPILGDSRQLRVQEIEFTGPQEGGGK